MSTVTTNTNENTEEEQEEVTPRTDLRKRVSNRLKGLVNGEDLQSLAYIAWNDNGSCVLSTGALERTKVDGEMEWIPKGKEDRVYTFNEMDAVLQGNQASKKYFHIDDPDQSRTIMQLYDLLLSERNEELNSLKTKTKTGEKNGEKTT